MDKNKNGFNSPNTRRIEKILPISSEDCRNVACDRDKEIGEVQTNLKLKLIPKEFVIIKPLSRSKSRRVVRSSAEEAELERFASMVINDRIAFCKKYKTGEEEVGKCACESIRRYIRLSRESASRAISKDKIYAIKKMFEWMKREGKIKCPEYKLP